MAKKRAIAAKQSGAATDSHENVPVSKQTAGGVTGAVLGGIVAGPVGALAGGAVGAMVGDASAKGKKPVKRAAEALREEISSGRAKAALKKVGERIKAMRPTKKKKKSAAKSAKKKKASSSKAAQSKVAKKKPAKGGRKKKAKKKA